METLRDYLRQFAVWLATVTAVPVGQSNDGVDRAFSSGTDVDKSWSALHQELSDAREAWRQNPLARRLINLTTAYVVGDGITLSSNYGPLKRYINEFWHHDKNHMALRLEDWCDELARSGELFPVLFTNPVDGMSYVRTIPASEIDQIEWKRGDYETETRYHQQTEGPRGFPEGAWWESVHSPARVEDYTSPVMFHYAVNRPIGAVRGESDLAPVLKWLRRYNRWLEDRVRLNAGARAFLWIVYAPSRLHAGLREKYRREPEPGSVVIADDAGEKWEAVSPNMHARDASADGKAIRWMIAAGGPGTGLLDLGEGDDANLATGRVMGEMRRRFLRRRQMYFGLMLADLIVHGYERWRVQGKHKGREVTIADVIVDLPDISVEDNQALAGAALEMARALKEVSDLVGHSSALRRAALRLFMKFAGESLSEDEFESILEEGAVDGENENGDELRAAGGGNKGDAAAGDDIDAAGLAGWLVDERNRTEREARAVGGWHVNGTGV